MVGDALGLVWIIWFGSSDRKCLLGATIRGRGPVPTGVIVRLNVRYGPLADIKERQSHVRFTPESRHSSAPVACPLSAKSGHTWGPISTLQWSERNGRQDAQEVGEGRKEGHRQARVATKAIKSRKTA